MNIIPTNCGVVDLLSQATQFTEQFRQGHIENVAPPSLLNGNIKYFHNMICQWAYAVPLKFHWVMTIEARNRSYLLNEISNLGSQYEPVAWDVNRSAEVSSNENVLSQMVGCIFAQGVNLPGENVNFEHAGVSEGSNRGFLNAPIITGRSNFEPLEVGFLDTNSSFVDGFLRPWSILVAHKGLVATNTSESIKANITVHQLARNGTDTQSVIRKSFLFEDCAPIYISGDTLDYNGGSDYPKLQAKFSYSKYYVTDTPRQ